MQPVKCWVPAPEWAGKIAVVVATGPSISAKQIRLIALARLADKCRVIAVNDAVLLCWWADICFGGDGKWWKARDWLPGFRGRKVQVDSSDPKPPPNVAMDFVRRVGSHGYDQRPGHICTHRNSGSMAVQVVADLGPAKILLVGFDMREVAGNRHFFGHYDGRLNTAPNIAEWISDFRALIAPLSGRLFNATPGSALDFVPAVDLESALSST